MRKESEGLPILPASLLVAGLPCLVVGGGKIAARKVGHLLDAGAGVTVVSPELIPELADAVTEERIQHVPREFEAGDADGQRLVFAVTDNVEVNQQVIACARAAGVLCSAADSNWPDGDLVMPAICRKRGLVVSVATGGRSCRIARVVKDRIAQLLDTIADEEAV
ncbi:MAG: bifunctional precorrin-2 dehydrogenase/sirohydrochlorin ferrochelatase [Kiritimatiellia bacterium]|jgi:precorrin-2 dehydrogenase/sirohydrochlorin ferrochelatase|nr:bifunctional precorrin-2 dehydrogenase/sirohydrochlorin ferrochelatase [Kiritimatiellia bacterium]MDP6630082.1 bifunctional precorrin-2 dehydrogenase/sirohydrochlorin ferrochelatase [Kiritimatiellia bacterium]MDP6811241.1 bifunctional precorrin-2 dehydrogenase/sirohydrochlorin ferrochelatase [Kiritimatiellia bacterium]MDP7024586.1 bifunctional precorrin-2 dehydrogenase/sirohydrochlorin ferrochelatase [Kiritimatiellia bacterium]